MRTSCSPASVRAERVSFEQRVDVAARIDLIGVPRAAAIRHVNAVLRLARDADTGGFGLPVVSCRLGRPHLNHRTRCTNLETSENAHHRTLRTVRTNERGLFPSIPPAAR